MGGEALRINYLGPPTGYLLDQGEELFPSLLVGPETSQHTGCCGDGTLLLHSSHRHAHVSRFHDHCDAPGFDSLLYGEGDLLGDPFLDGQSATECFSDPREL